MPIVRVEGQISGLGGSPGYTRMHYEVADATEGSTDMDFVGGSFTEFWQAMQGMIFVGVTVTPLPEALIINPATGQTTGVVPVDADPATGTSPDDPLPWTTQGLIRLRTGVYSGGREARGRVFVPGVTEAVSTGGRPTATALNLMVAAGVALQQEGAATPVVISRGQAVPVTAISPWNEWASLRSRRD